LFGAFSQTRKAGEGLGKEEFASTYHSAVAGALATPPTIFEPPTNVGAIFKPLDLSFHETLLPPRPWVAQDVLLRRKVSQLIAPGGTGKSVLTLAWAVAIASGKGDFISLKVKEKTNVLIANAEDDETETQRRMAGVAYVHRLELETISNRLFVYAPKSASKLIVAEPGDGRKIAINRAALQQLVDYMKGNSIGVVIFDPLISIHRADENSNTDMEVVMEALEWLAEETGAAVLIVHHTRKQSGTSSEGHAGNADSGRGAGAVRDATRITLTLYSMSEKDAGNYGIEPALRRRYIRLDTGKMNYSAPGGEEEWFELVSYRLANGDGVGVPLPKKLEKKDKAKGKTAQDLKPSERQLLDVFERHGPLEPEEAKRLFMAEYKSKKGKADSKTARKVHPDAEKRLIMLGCVIQREDGKLSRPPMPDISTSPESSFANALGTKAD
jgi:hypothetical protein